MERILDNINNMEYLLYSLSPIAILVSAWWASNNAVKAIEATRDANKASIAHAESIARKKNAIDMILRTQSDDRLHRAYKKIREIHESSDQDISKFAYRDCKDDDRALAHEIGYVLNHFEHVANGINQDIFDEGTIKNSQWGTITNLYKYCTKFIEIVRDQHSRPTIYMELENLAKKWCKNPLNKTSDMNNVNYH